MTRTAKWLILIVLAVAVVIFAIPRFLSSSYVKERVAAQLSDLTGLPVQLNGTGSVTFSPFLWVSFHDVWFGHSVPLADVPPLLATDHLRARLTLGSAFWGEAELARVTLVRPRLNLRIDGDGKANWILPDGAFAGLVEGDGETVDLGQLTIEDGIAVFSDQRSGSVHEITGVNGTIDWPDTAADVALQLTGVWRGEVVSVRGEAGNPAGLFRGEQSAVAASVSSNPATIQFNGTIQTGINASARGTVSVNAPSPRRLSEWLQNDVAVFDSLAETSLDGQIALTAESVQFPEVTVRSGAHIGTGRLQIEHKDGQPSLSGTLAFDTLALPDPDLFASQPSGEGQPEKLDLTSLEGFGLDLRLSAASMSGAPFEMTDVAAAVIVRKGSATFEIGAAQALSGTVAGTVSVHEGQGVTEFVTDISLMDITLEQLSSLYGANDIALNGQGDARFRLKSVGTSTSGLLLNLNGEGFVESEDGVVVGVDLRTVISNASVNGSERQTVLEGSTPYEHVKITFSIANGTAFLRGSLLKSPVLETELGGQVDLVRRSLALRGTVIPASGDENSRIEIPFFVGGSTTSPLFVALPAHPTEEKKHPPPAPTQ